MRVINLGLIGFGTIGTGMVKVLKERIPFFERELGIKLSLTAICDKDILTRRKVEIDKDILTQDVSRVVDDPQIDIVIELVGGLHPAKEFILRALKNKKHVVTANKALLAECGEEIFKYAEQQGVDVYFEASVGGGIPIIEALREGFVANKIEKIYGIINGTCNYILTQMSDKGCAFRVALKDAQDRGYAEKNPGLDINGIDSAHKIAILSRLCFKQKIPLEKIFIEGIRNISLSDIRYADELGYSIKLLAIAKRTSSNLQIRVHPTLLPKDHLLSNVQGVFNALFVNAALIGQALFFGQGAGQMPTASAVVSDIIFLAEKIQRPLVADNAKKTKIKIKEKPICTIDDIESRYYIRFSALDKPAVLAKVSAILGKYGISIFSVIQKGRRQAHIVPVVIMTHEAKEKNMRKALSEIDMLTVIKNKSVAIRVERV
ncbi:MAG: homoserine dehydrogenase [Candidatus Omnitrophica bacterium]|nr:homoserine dehydrogenase [Candidatus Omnitrophota bacterium]